TYPGVYVEELPSGVHTIVGVPTSIAAFVGRALRGVVNDRPTVNGFADFGRTFGGLGAGYPMSYAVRDFFANGGGEAIIVRVYGSAPAASANSTSMSSASSLSSSSSVVIMPLQADGIARIDETGPDSIGLALEAADPGAWGNNLTVHIVKPP